MLLKSLPICNVFVCRRALLAAFGNEGHAAMLLRLLHELSDSGLVSQVKEPERLERLVAVPFL